jgi:3-methyladenine DNA glycosylase/8-oxoguanine DNA glycosylase
VRRHDFPAHLVLAERHLAKTSATMRGLIRRHGSCGLSPKWDQRPFDALVRAVIYQQLHGKAAATILRRFVDLFPDAAFPKPEHVLAATDEELRSAGLSRQKLSYIRDLAVHALSGGIPVRRSQLARLSDAAIIERITQVKGIGRWTVEMLLIFSFGRLDILPVDDFGVRKGYTKAFRCSAPVTLNELRERGQAWAPYRSVAAWYFWREAETA